jgi:hypothetical protein
VAGPSGVVDGADVVAPSGSLSAGFGGGKMESHANQIVSEIRMAHIVLRSIVLAHLAGVPAAART